jgi:hypothetical protein
VQLERREQKVESLRTAVPDATPATGALHNMVLLAATGEPMSKHNSVTKRNRRPKSEKRVDYTARTMAAVKQLEQAAKLRIK